MIQLGRHKVEKLHEDTGERQVFYIVVGPTGAVTTSFFVMDRISIRGRKSLCTGIDWHSPKPMYDDQEPQGPCEWIESTCYCDGTSLPGVPAEEWFDNDDDETIFAWLAGRYGDH